jgi:hypothetical protein
MKISRSTRFLTAIVAMLGMLYMQFAVASYVCPGTQADGGNGGALVQAAMPDMPNCQGMDAVQPQLCHLYAHGELSKQSLDKPAPDVPPFVAAALMLQLQSINAAVMPAARSYRPIALARTTAPPVAIRHCCFRI